MDGRESVVTKERGVMKTTPTPWTRSVAALLCGAILASAAGIPTTTHAAPRTAVTSSSWLQGWPMVGHDPQHTNRSASTGPLTPHLLFTYPGPCGVPLIGPDSSFYSWCAQGLTALTAGRTAPVDSASVAVRRRA